MSTPKTVKNYISNESPKIRKVLNQMRSLVRKAAPKATEKIAWGMPTLVLEGNLLHYAAFKDHVSLFPGSEPIKHFAKELSAYVTSKGTIQFPYEKKLPATLITKVAKFCVKRNIALAAAKRKKKSLRRRSRKS